MHITRMRNSCNLLLKKFLVDLYHHMDLADFKEALHPALRAINVEGVGSLVGSSSALWPSLAPTVGRTDAGKTHLFDGRTDGRTQNKGVCALQSVERETSLRCSLISLEGCSACQIF